MLKAILFMVIGVATAFSALMDYDWFMNSYKATPLKALLGRDGARIVYILAGVAIFCYGAMPLL